jgi:hypothetical protein
VKPSEQRERAFWLWQKYLAAGEVSYLAAPVRDEDFYLHPTQVSGSLLLLAIEHRDLPAVKLLLEELGADVNAPAPDGYSYLHRALEIDEVERLVPMLFLLRSLCSTSSSRQSQTLRRRNALRLFRPTVLSTCSCSTPSSQTGRA